MIEINIKKLSTGEIIRSQVRTKTSVHEGDMLMCFIFTFSN